MPRIQVWFVSNSCSWLYLMYVLWILMLEFTIFFFPWLRGVAEWSIVRGRKDLLEYPVRELLYQYVFARAFQSASIRPKWSIMFQLLSQEQFCWSQIFTLYFTYVFVPILLTLNNFFFMAVFCSSLVHLFSW